MSDQEYPLTRSKRHQSKKKKKPKSKKPLMIAAIILVLLGSFMYVFRKELIPIAFQLFLEDTVKDKLNDAYDPIKEVTGPAGEEDAKDKLKKPFSMLLLGVDEREGDVGRSDTMIYAVFRPEEHRMLLMSIPRDSYVEIAGRDKRDKVNAAYAYGGTKMSVETVEQLLQTNVDYYAKVNFQALVEVVDALGGVKLPITEVIENKYKYHVKLRIEPNKPIYDGEDALNYVRYREDSDFMRTERQRTFIKAATERALEMGNIMKIPQLIDIASSNMKTDMTSDFIINLAEVLYAKESVPQMSSYMLKGEGENKSYGWYYMLSDQGLTEAQQLVDNWMDANTASDELIDPEKKEQ
ncbi:LCP family protein [Paenibacillus sp. Marseille-Q4541]|uniref:LCP family protein n=1 Tax=Paenibacillus sp. Marseille-Q4541 TaxID=2831522 RepID=UPI00201957A1|nr:LCP family protein [Paenibacillus sp. Marseille-Q4541]